MKYQSYEERQKIYIPKHKAWVALTKSTPIKETITQETNFQELGQNNEPIEVIKYYENDTRHIKWQSEFSQQAEYSEDGSIIKQSYLEEHFEELFEANEIDFMDIEENDKLIESYKAQIIEEGFNYNGHQQRGRTYKDVPLLGTAVLNTQIRNDNIEEYSKQWAFDDGDTPILTLEDMKNLSLYGEEFFDAIYKVEAFYKMKQNRKLDLTLEEYKEMVNQLSTNVKCW